MWLHRFWLNRAKEDVKHLRWIRPHFTTLLYADATVRGAATLIEERLTLQQGHDPSAAASLQTWAKIVPNRAGDTAAGSRTRSSCNDGYFKYLKSFVEKVKTSEDICEFSHMFRSSVNIRDLFYIKLTPCTTGFQISIYRYIYIILLHTVLTANTV